MNRTYCLILICGALTVGHAPARAADAPQSVEAQLRDRLRATMLQVRTLETERASLQAAQTQSATEKKALTEKLEAVTKQANEYRLVAQTVDGLKTDLARQEKEIARLKETIAQCQQAAAAAREQEAQRAKIVAEIVAGLERLVADRQAKNLALFQVANEILDRYEKFGLGTALTAREPFVGITRVKLETLVQDYRDKVAAQRTVLTENDLAAHRDRLLNPPPRAAAPASEETAN